MGFGRLGNNMKKFLANKKGVTVLEGLIAMTLLALVATGTFGVLLSVSRKSAQPDLREEMALAIDKAAQKLQAYVFPSGMGSNLEALNSNLAGGVCGTESSIDTVLSIGEHNINCLLPPICDGNSSSFTYTVSRGAQGLPNQASNLRALDRLKQRDASGEATSTQDINGQFVWQITFNITCNGFTL